MRNITTYAMSAAIYLATIEQLTVDPLTHLSRDLTDLELSHLGFASTPPWSDDTSTHVDVILTERVLPSEVIALKLHERCRAFEQESGAWPGTKRTRELKTQLLTELIPSAPVRRTRIEVCFTCAGGHHWVLVGTAKAKLAEDVLKLIRRELGSFPVQPVAIDTDVALFFTEVARGVAAPGLKGLALLDSVLLEAKGSAARLKGIELDSESVKEHLRSGMKATRLWFQRGDTSSFEVDKDLTLRNFGLLEVEEEWATDEIERWGSDRAMRVMESAELRAILWQLSLWLDIAPVAEKKEPA